MLAEEIQSAIKNGAATLGYNESIKQIKTVSPKIILIANNMPEDKKKEVEHNAKTGNIKLEIFQGTSKDLGTLCGVPFPVSIMTVK